MVADAAISAAATAAAISAGTKGGREAPVITCELLWSQVIGVGGDKMSEGEAGRGGKGGARYLGSCFWMASSFSYVYSRRRKRGGGGGGRAVVVVAQRDEDYGRCGWLG